jgi:hypothetical protein
MLLLGVSFAAALPATFAGEGNKKPAAALASDTQHRKVTLTPGRAGMLFDFETEQIRGSIKLDGDYHGVSRLIDKRTGLQVVDSRYSLLNLFRLFSVNLGLGTPRSMKGTIKFQADMAQVTWGATEAHRGHITARYEVREPNIVDLTITVRSQAVYAGYEILLPSYFEKSMLPHVYLKRREDAADADWVLPTVNDVFRGGVLAFPRDEHAARRYVDGRWSRGEYGMPYAPFYPVRRYAEPLGVMTDRDKKLGVVLMAGVRQCSGVSCRYHADKDSDRATSYSAIDLTLFGDDLVPGDERTANVRLQLLSLDGDLDRALAACRAFVTSKK